jgi:hypothetical protein
MGSPTVAAGAVVARDGSDAGSARGDCPSESSPNVPARGPSDRARSRATSGARRAGRGAAPVDATPGPVPGRRSPVAGSLADPNAPRGSFGSSAVVTATRSDGVTSAWASSER